MKPRILAVILANLFAVSAASAQEGPFSGSVSLGGIGSNIDDARDEARANEFRDLDSGALLHFNLAGRSGRGWFDLFGENIGRDDQFADLNGGLYGLLKGRLYLNDIIHNHAFGARTPLAGAGGATLVGTTTGTGTTRTFDTNPDTWSTYDAKIKRRNIGGFVEVSPGASVYVRVDANETRWDGIRIQGQAQGMSPGNGFQDIPTPVDYVVRTASVEAGYSSRQLTVSGSLSRSKFTNENDLMNWTNPFYNGVQETTVLPQDNEQTKWAINAALKQLPLNSTLAARATYAKTENSVGILQSIFITGNTSNPTASTSVPTTFDGEIVHKTASVALNSNLTRTVDSKLYWNQYKKENESSDVHFSVQNIHPHIFSYDKNNYGVEVGFRLPRQTKVVVGYDYTNLDRDRADFDNSKDKKAFIEVKTAAWDIATVRAKVQSLERRSNFLEGDAGVNANDPLYLTRYVARFDTSNVDQDLVKIGVDLAPAPLLDIGVEAIYKRNDFKDTVLGRTSDVRREIYASVSFGDREKARITAFADAEWIKYDSLHRNISTVAGGPTPPPGFCTLANPNCFDPINGPSNTGSYNWFGRVNERNVMLGVGADVVVNPRLKFNAAYTYTRTQGTTDLSSPSFVNLVDVGAVDNVKISTFHVKGTFAVSRKVDVTAGYAHERLDYNDQAYEGYQFTVPGGNASQRSYLSGLYGFQDYKANIGYVYVTYRF